MHAPASAGQGEAAARVLDHRLSRRASALDARRRRAALSAATVDGSGGTTT